MGQVIDITVENFEEIVIRGSMERPVVVDFWAQWCGPCKVLGPLLEKLSQELDFVLAKINTEEQADLAGYFRISSIPDVRIFQEGRLVDGFQGALPEAQLRKRLNKYFLSPMDLLLQEIDNYFSAGQAAEGLRLATDALAEFPGEKKLLYRQGKGLVDTGNLEQARKVLQGFSEGDDCFSAAKALLELMEFHAECARKDLTSPEDLAYQGACSLAVQGKMAEALEAFLQLVVLRNNYRDNAARKAMITLFGVLGPKHELVWEYRSKLNTILFI